MGKDREDDFDHPVEFHGASGGEHFNERFSEAAYQRFKNGRGNAPGARAGDADGGYAAEQWENKMRADWNKQMATAAATGSWVTSASEAAKTLYEEDNMDFNTMKRYAQLAGVSDIGTENDVAAIREAYNNAHTTEDELQGAISGLRDELTESVAEGGDQTAVEGTTFNDYLEQSESAKLVPGTPGNAPGPSDQSEEEAQSMLSDNVKQIAGKKDLMDKAKASQGQYVLKNLQSKEYAGGN